MPVVAIHGAFGSPKDWDCFDLDLHAVRMEENLDVFLDKVQQVPPPRYLMGYSLGGRYGLQVLVKDPSLWEKAIFISTHPGLKCAEERAVRYKSDQVWTRKLREEPWEQVIKDWEAQEMFKGAAFTFERVQDPEYHAMLFEKFSLGKQGNLKKEIERLSLPQLWITGESDVKFTQLVGELEGVKREVIAGAGHRVPWESKTVFEKVVREFLS